MRVRSSKCFIYASVLAMIGCCTGVFAITTHGSRRRAAIVSQFYSDHGSSLFWYDSSSASSAMLRKAVSDVIDSAKYYGLDKRAYHFPDNSAQTNGDVISRDRLITNALVDLALDVYEGAFMERYIRNDELSGRFTSGSDSVVLAWLSNIKQQTNLQEYLGQLEPRDSSYHILKAELRHQIASGNSAKTKKLVACVNIYRWMKHFNFQRYIMVNIPAAMLTVYEKGRPVMDMKVVVGKPATRTPRFSTWCHKVILYPYWNVPASIAHKELLPVFKRSPAQVEKMNMQIIGKNGRAVDPYSLNWSSFDPGNFPYTIRQCTGCDNALGVIKFDLTDPFGVYMHDTNFKPAFGSVTRYFSHGCIRVERPLDLGNYLLNGKLDSNFLKACLKEQEPVPIAIEAPIPVFVVYLPVEVQSGNIIYLKDIYHLY